MSRLVEEVREWHTPVVGAYLLWRFTCAYHENHQVGDVPVVFLHFIAFSMLTSNDYLAEISGRRKNLSSYIRSFKENKRSDILACLSQRVCQQRGMTMQAIDIAVATGLLAWDAETAKLHPLEGVSAKRGSASRSIGVQELAKKAEIVGSWFSAEPDIATITSSLGVLL
jgi:hypothetical protein